MKKSIATATKAFIAICKEASLDILHPEERNNTGRDMGVPQGVAGAAATELEGLVERSAGLCARWGQGRRGQRSAPQSDYASLTLQRPEVLVVRPRQGTLPRGHPA